MFCFKLQLQETISILGVIFTKMCVSERQRDTEKDRERDIDREGETQTERHRQRYTDR